MDVSTAPVIWKKIVFPTCSFSSTFTQSQFPHSILGEDWLRENFSKVAFIFPISNTFSLTQVFYSRKSASSLPLNPVQNCLSHQKMVKSQVTNKNTFIAWISCGIICSHNEETRKHSHQHNDQLHREGHRLATGVKVLTSVPNFYPSY